MKVKDAMTRDVVTISPKASIKTAAREMIDNDIGCLGVVAGDEFLGIITENDLVRIIADKKVQNPSKISVGLAMRNNCLCTGPDADIVSLLNRMKKRGVKKAPVLRGKRIVGIITATDLAISCPAFRK